MRLHAPFSTLIVSCLLSVLTRAVFIDEAYQNDYHHALLGVPQAQNTFFHRPSAVSKASLLYTLSERAILGAVNPKDGAVVWRQRLLESTSRERKQTRSGFLRAGLGENTIVSGLEGTIRSWDASDGRLVWEWTGPGIIKWLEVLEMDGASKDVLVLHEEEGRVGVVRRLSAQTGQVLWSFKEESGDLPYGVSASSDEIHYISLHSALLKGFKIKVAQLDPNTGQQIRQSTLNSDGEVSSMESILFLGTTSAVPLLVWTDKTVKVLKLNVLGRKQVHSISIQDGGEEVDTILIHAPRSIKAQPHFLIHYQTNKSHWAEVYHFDLSTLSVTQAYSLPRLGGRGMFSVSTEDAKVYFTRNTDLETSLSASVSHGILGRWPVRPRSRRGLAAPDELSAAVSEAVSRGGTAYAVRSALTFSSGDWELVRNGDSIWLRSEGAAGIVSAAWAEISEVETLINDLTAESAQDVFSAYIRRVRRHTKYLKSFPGWMQRLPSWIFGTFVDSNAGIRGTVQSRDAFGIRKLVVAATEQGRLIALDAGRGGETIFNTKAVDLGPGEVWQVSDIEIEGPTAVVREGNGRALAFEISTGEIIQKNQAGKSLSMKKLIPFKDVKGEKQLLPVLSDGSLGEIAGIEFPNSTMIVTKGDDGIIRGWKAANNTKPQLAWDFEAAAGESILSTTIRPIHDPVASIGKALGDRTVLYKYLNPNLLLVTAIGVTTSTLSIYLIDSVSGEILHTSTHTGVDRTQPITSTFSEHWFAYSLFCDSAAAIQPNGTATQPPPKGQQLIFTELFESQFPNDRGSLGATSEISSADPVTSQDGGVLSEPHVISSAFVMSSPISYMTTTSTLQGITPRSLLCVLPTLNSLVSIPRHLTDPRRPVSRDPTSSEAEEGLFRYNPALELDPKWFLNHQREVMGIEKIITSPTLLESTSLVFAYGELDIFGTRVAPIGAFDILGKGFSKLQLIGTVLALGVGTGILAPMVRKKQIDGQWTA